MIEAEKRLQPARRWAAAGTQTQPSRPAGQSTPGQSPSSIPFPSFSGKPSSRKAFSDLISPCLAAGPLWLLSASSRSCRPRGTETAETGVSFPPRPILLLSSRRPQPPPEARAPATIDAGRGGGGRSGRLGWGGRGGGAAFVVRASKEHYGGARSRLRPPAPASRVRSPDWRRPRGREARGGTRPPLRAQPAASAAMAERRAFAQKISR